MAVRPKLMIGIGIGIAGLGLISAGAGATFTAQVSATSSISSGGLGLSLNGETGSGVDLNLDGKNISSHFTPISKDLQLKNTGTLNMASTFLKVTATGCDGGKAAPLAKALRVKLMDVTHDKQVYDGPLCSLASSTIEEGASSNTEKTAKNSRNEHGFITPPAHTSAGGQLPHTLDAGDTILYRIVIQPNDTDEGLPPEAQYAKTSVKLIFNGFDY